MAYQVTQTKTREDAVKAALIVGNFEAAVERCCGTYNLADAIELASCGGMELWSTAQEWYFQLEPRIGLFSRLGFAFGLFRVV